MAFLENRSDSHSELLTTVIAFLQANSLTPSLILNTSQGVYAPRATAMRANGTIAPNNALKFIERRLLVLEIWLVQNASHCPILT